MTDANGNTAITEVPKRTAAPIMAGRRGLELRTIEDMYRFATYVVASKLAPKGMDSEPAVVIAIQLGAEIGLSPMQAVQNIAVINGRPSVWGDAVKGLVLATGECVGFSEYFEGDGDKLTAICEIERRGYETVRRTFSVADAKTAELWSKAGPWKQYPKRMLQMRARSWACRDAFPDALRGLFFAEETQDMPPVDVTPQEPARKPVERATVDVAGIRAGTQPEGDHKATPESSPQPAFDRKAALEAIGEAAGRDLDAFDAACVTVAHQTDQTSDDPAKWTDDGVKALYAQMAG